MGSQLVLGLNMEAPVMIALIGLGLEIVTMLVMGVWLIGKFNTGLALNQQATKSLKEAMTALAESNEKLAIAISHLDKRLTIVETKADSV